MCLFDNGSVAPASLHYPISKLTVGVEHAKQALPWQDRSTLGRGIVEP